MKLSTRFFLMLFGTLPALLPAQSICFDPAADNRYETGSQPAASATADFNNDGKPDIATAYPGGVSILFGNGTVNNTFAPAISYPHPLGSYAIAAADFSGDNKADIAIFGSPNDSADLVLFVNDGTGNFGSLVLLNFNTGNSSGLYEGDMAMGDFNGDGKNDLVINSKPNDVLYILKNNGNSTFTVSDTLLTGDNPNSLAVGDLNNDNRADIAVTYGYGTSSNDSLSFFMNNGSGLFGNRTSVYNITFPSNRNAIAIARINADNFGDLVFQQSTDLKVMLNNGSQVFTAQPNVFVGGYAGNILSGDFNSDSKTDLAISDNTGKRISVALGNGTGTFQPYTAYSAEGKSAHILWQDFDNDSRKDMISTNRQSTGNISFLKGQTDGSFGSFSLRALQRPRAIKAGLVNNDTLEDLVIVHDQSKRIGIMLGNADGTFQNTVYDSCWWAKIDLELGDFNNDNKLDAVAVGSTTEILSGDNTGHFTLVGTLNKGFAGGGDYSSGIADFNGDNKLDLVICYVNDDSMSVLLGNGDFTFAAPVKYATGDGPGKLFVFDMNKDGKADVLVPNDQSNDVRIYINNGNGTFQQPVSFSTGNNPRAVAAGYFNGDNIPDFVAANGNGNSISVYLATANMAFSAPVAYTLGTNLSLREIAVGKVNADTIVDLLVLDQSAADQVFLLLGNGDGTFQSASAYGTGAQPYEITTGDFNNDGALDFATVNSNGNNVTVVLNNSSFITASGPTAICAGDSVQLTAGNGFSFAWSTGATTQAVWVNTSGTYQVSVTNQAGTCTVVPPAVSVTSNTLPNVTFNTNSNGRKCISDGTLNLANVGGQPQGGIYSGNFVSNGILNITAAGAGEHIVTYTYTNGCGNGSASDTIFVDTEVLAAINLPQDTFCTSYGTLTLSQYGTPAGGMWGTNNQVISTINFAQIPENDYLVHYTIEAGGCRDTAYTTVTVINCTGLEEITARNGISVFYDVSTDAYIIEIANDSKYTQARVTDITGKVVYEEKLHAGDVTAIRKNGLPPGVYVLQVIGGRPFAQKLIFN